MMLLPLLLGTLQSLAQRDVGDILRSLKEGGVTLYLEGAINRSLPGLDSFDRRWFPGAGFGAFKTYAGGMGWKAALEYNGHSYTQTYRDLAQLTTRNITAHYLDLPVSALFVLDRRVPDLTAEIGFIPSLYLGSALSRPDSVPMNASRSVADARNETAFNAMMMAGLTLPLGSLLHITVQYRYPVPFSYKNDREVTGRVPALRCGIRVPVNRGKPKEIAEPGPPVINTTRDFEIYVRLNPQMAQVKALRDAGKEADAEVLRLKTETRNQQIAEAFLSNLSPGKAYFFAMDDSKLMLENVNGVVFLNPQTLERDTAIKPVRTNYLIAEFGTVPLEEFGQRSGEGIVVYDRNFELLKEPFPFFTYASGGLSNPAETVRKFSRKLARYLTRHGIAPEIQ